MTFSLLMAWRDFRARPSRFLLYVGAIAIGVGSLTAIESFRRQLNDAITGQGRNLLGADLLLRSIRPFTSEQMAIVDAWPGRKSRSIRYRTLMLHPESERTRLVEVEAVEPEFPYYGEIATDPEPARRDFHEKGEALLDQTLMMQMGLSVGDEIRLGGQAFRVGGELLQSPGEVPARSLMAPKVNIPYRLVDDQRLTSPSIMARFEWYLAAAVDAGDESLVKRVQQAARRVRLDVETVASRREQLLGSTDRISRYLGLMGFTSLMIGCLGVAGAVHFFISSKRQSVAQLRCIGASLYQAAGMFVVQLVLLALTGSTLGVAVGLMVGRYLPSLLALFIPVPVDVGVRLDAAASAWMIGVLFTVLAGVFPLTRLRRISPLVSLRIDESAQKFRFDLAGGIAVAALLAALFVFAVHQLGSAKLASMYLGGVAVVLGVLMLTGMLLRKGCRLLVRPGWSYPVRLAVSGLYRPQNQTGLLMISLGLGIFLLNTVDVMEHHLLKDVEATQRDRPNLAMIDIQVDQRDALLDVLAGYHPASVFTEPMITMRLAAINGTPVENIVNDPGRSRPGWALRREYRTTYRSEQKPDIETVIAGNWIDGEIAPTNVIPISLEKGIAEALQVWVGDSLRYDIHGEMVETRIANIREVNWKSMQPNFFVIFPRGVIEDAPQTILVFCQMDDIRDRALFQRDMAMQFPNVTAIDVSLMMDTVSSIMAKLAAAVRAMAWFTLLAGFLVLLAILRAGRIQRLKEGVLLRTIGSSRSVIARYQAMEFAILTFGAILSGLLLSWLGAGLVIHFVFKLSYQPDWTSAWLYPAILMTMTMLLGWINGIAATRLSPADAWRSLSI